MLTISAFAILFGILLLVLAVRDELQHADLIMGFGVYDTRVPEHCAELYSEGLAPFILFSGGHGRGSGPLSEPEALFFRERALKGGAVTMPSYLPFWGRRNASRHME